MSRSARPTINIGERVREGVVEANASHRDFDEKVYASEVLDARAIRMGWWLGRDGDEGGEGTSNDGEREVEGERNKERKTQKRTSPEMLMPHALAEMLRATNNSAGLQELRRRAFESVKLLKREPKTGTRASEEYDNALTSKDTTTWGAPELVHASAEEVRGFFSALANNDVLSALERRAPHGVRTRKLFETLYEYRVPMHRAMWFVKINYLSQCRRDIDGCRRVWTEHLISHLRELLQDEGIVSAAKEPQSELHYVMGLGNYSIENDLIDHKSYFAYFMQFLLEHKKNSQRGIVKSSDVLHALMPVLKALVPEAVRSNASALLFVENIRWYLREVLSEKRIDGKVVARASDVIGTVVSANIDAFVAAPRGQGVDAIDDLQRSFESKRIKFSSRLCGALDQTTKRIKSLQRASDPKAIAIHFSKLVLILHKLTGLDEVQGRETIKGFIEGEIKSELAKKTMIEVSCDWAMDLSTPDTGLRLQAACIALDEVCSSSAFLIAEILSWIKRSSLIDEEKKMKTSLISNFVVEMIRNDVLTLQQLVDFVIANGIVEKHGSGSPNILVERFYEIFVHALKHYENDEEDIEEKLMRTIKQLLKSAEDVMRTVTRASTLDSTSPSPQAWMPFQVENEKRLFDLFCTTNVAKMVSKLSELRTIQTELGAHSDAQKTFCRVIVMALAHKPSQSAMIAELVCELDTELAKAVLSYVNKDVLGVKNLKNTESIFCGSEWNKSTSSERWTIARSVGEFQLCLLHGIPIGKKALAEQIIDADFAQLAELAAASTTISHSLMHIWLRLSTIMPLIGYVFMSVAASEKFSQLILTVLDSFTGKAVIESFEDLFAAESEVGESLVDVLVHLFSVVSIGQVPQWVPILPKLPYRETSSLKRSLELALSKSQIAAVVQLRLKRALGTRISAPSLSSSKVDSWQILESGTHAIDLGLVATKSSEKAAFWLEGAVRKPAGNLAWENVEAVPTVKN